MPRTIAVEIVGDASSLERSFRKASRDANQFGRGLERQTRRSSGALRGFTKIAGLATAGLGAAGLAGAVKASFDEMLQSQKVAAQTRAVLKSTGGQAGITADHVDKLASRLLNLTGIDDETITSTENLLLTFTKIGRQGGIFDQATSTVLDMSVALGEDTKSAAIQLGKALQDPIRGIDSLRRVGVTFTDEQKDQIKQLVATGHQMEAQRIILAELHKEFGGSAKAAGDTFAGSLHKLEEQAKNLGGEIAQTLAPSIERVVKRITDWLSKSQNQKQVLDTVKQAAAAVSDVIKALKIAMDALNKITGSTKHSLELLFAALVAFKTVKLAASLADIAANVGLIGTNAGRSTRGVKGLKGALTSLPAKLTVQIAIVVALYGPAKKLWEQVFGTSAFQGIAPDKTVSVGGKTFIKGSIAELQARQQRQALAGGLRAGLAGNGTSIYIEHFHSSAENPRLLENELTKRAKARGHVRRGSR
jgi:hypothetical protein